MKHTKRLPGKMSGLKPGSRGKPRKVAPAKYAEGGPVTNASGQKVTGTARGMGAAKRGGNFEY